MSTERRRSPKPVLSAVPPAPAERHVQPTHEQRAAADDFLRQRPLAPEYEELVRETVERLDDIERFYVEEAREQGEGTRIWNTAGWLVANAIARAANASSG